MYLPFLDVLTRAFLAIQRSPKPTLVRKDSRRFDSKQMLDFVELLENVFRAAQQFARSTDYYQRNNWPSSVARRMRKRKICHESSVLSECLAQIGNSLYHVVQRLESQTCRHEMIDYLKGIHALERGMYIGAPAISPVARFVNSQDEGSPVVIHFVVDALPARKFGKSELRRFHEGDYSVFSFFESADLDSIRSTEIVRDALSTLPAIHAVCQDYRKWFRETITIDDLVAEIE